ncbi:MAG: nuclear transport factor 2 family protein [Dinghuibacter sp.]|nr:nuclear transport factor 2 family protein [Dinghuibacter sp.]
MKRLLVLAGIVYSSLLCAQEKTVAEQLAQQQLDAYNKHDIEAFLAPYSDSVAVYMFPNQLMYKGKANMRKEYADMFAGTPDLNCQLVNRIVLKNTVIDQEKVVFDKNRPPLEAIAIYTIENNKIAKVHFLMPR